MTEANNDVISVRLEEGTVKRIEEINKILFYSQSISDYVRRVIGESIKQDELVVDTKRENDKRRNK